MQLFGSSIIKIPSPKIKKILNNILNYIYLHPKRIKSLFSSIGIRLIQGIGTLVPSLPLNKGSFE